MYDCEETPEIQIILPTSPSCDPVLRAQAKRRSDCFQGVYLPNEGKEIKFFPYPFSLSQPFESSILPRQTNSLYVGFCLIETTIYLTGGYYRQKYQKCTYTLPVNSNSSQLMFTKRADMHVEREAHGCCTVSGLGGDLYVVGGRNSNLELNSAERYDIKADKWQVIGNLHEKRASPSTLGFQSRYLYVIGGNHQLKSCSGIERLDTLEEERSWEVIKIPLGLDGMCVMIQAAQIGDNEIYVFGAAPETFNLRLLVKEQKLKEHDLDINARALRIPFLRKGNLYTACVGFDTGLIGYSILKRKWIEC